MDQKQSAETELMITHDLFTKFSRVLIISAEVRGNDLAVNYIYFSDFNGADLENANFKNAGLNYSNFYQANLTNADLSGADLSNANLNGAILDGANLTCKNHPVCN